WPALADRLARIEADREARFQLDGPDPAGASSFDARIWSLGDGARPPGWVLVLRDITEHKRAEEERVGMLREQAAPAEADAGRPREQAARAEAEAANRAKARFLPTLSHELTPLPPILATATAMLDDPTTPSAFRSVLEMIRRNVALKARLIDDLLDLTRVRRGKLHLQREIIDAHQLIHQVVDICRADAPSAPPALVLDL